MNWMDQINEIKNNGPSIAEEKEQWKKHSIYKVPSQVKNLNEKAYKPQAISFGPYHYGEKNLELMEKHKDRAVVRFLKRCEKSIELLFQLLDQEAQELKDSYKSLHPIDTPKFFEMMIRDGCFILEILRVNDNDSEISIEYDENDPIFGNHGKLHAMPYIKRDMLILENQIPMKVLHILIQVENGNTEEEDWHNWLNEKIINLLNPSMDLIGSLGKCMHVLDVYRKSVIQEEEPRRHPTTPKPKSTKRDWLCLEAQDEDYFIRSAVALQDAGISFRKSETRSLKDFSFNRGVLRLPTLKLDDSTEYIFLNLIAFERLHIGTGSEITSFIFLMDTIIDSAMDVSILSRNGILINAFGNDQIVANLFNSMSKEIPVDRNGALEKVRGNMNHYCKKPWKRWRASLIHTYFRSPWAMVSLVAAFFLFVLTIIQTIYTVGQFYQGEC